MSYQAAVAHFANTDQRLWQLAQQLPPLTELTPKTPDLYFSELCDAITSQQLSVKAAATIWQRFLTLFPDQVVTPAAALRLTEEEMRAIGCSYAKARYIHDLAEHTMAGDLPFSEFEKCTNEQVSSALTTVKGIGPWTAEMFLIFTMARPDVFSAGDLGLKNAIAHWYTSPPDPLVWAPYRSYASRILWKSLDLIK